MQLTAEACRKVLSYFIQRNNVVFATPVEYDHFGFDTPDGNYLEAQRKVQETLPKATIIRSDIQDKTEAMSYINSSKAFPETQIYNFYAS